MPDLTQQLAEGKRACRCGRVSPVIGTDCCLPCARGVGHARWCDTFHQWPEVVGR